MKEILKPLVTTSLHPHLCLSLLSAAMHFSHLNCITDKRARLALLWAGLCLLLILQSSVTSMPNTVIFELVSCWLMYEPCSSTPWQRSVQNLHPGCWDRKVSGITSAVPRDRFFAQVYSEVSYFLARFLEEEFSLLYFKHGEMTYPHHVRCCCSLFGFTK